MDDPAAHHGAAVKVSFIVPARNEEHGIVDCLRALQAQDVRCSQEIVVVDNGSSDGTASVAASLGARVVHEPRPGLANARQAGLLAASGEIVIYVDADTQLTPDWAGEAVRRFDAEPALVALSSAFVFHDGRWIDDLGCALFTAILMPLTSFMLRTTRRPGVLIGAAFAARAEALRAVGGVDPTFQFYGEDTMIARRLHQQGEVRFLPRPLFITSARRYQRKGLLNVVYRYFLVFALIQLGFIDAARTMAARFQIQELREVMKERQPGPPAPSARHVSVTGDWEMIAPLALLEEQVAPGEP